VGKYPKENIQDSERGENLKTTVSYHVWHVIYIKQAKEFSWGLNNVLCFQQ
jgi:hypothetical protein